MLIRRLGFRGDLATVPWLRRANVLVPPQRDVQQCPALFFQERQDLLKLKQVGGFTEVLHLVHHEGSEFGVAPFPHRYAETLLPPADKLLRDDAPRCLLQNIFEYTVFGLYSRRNAHVYLDKFVVEDGNTI